MRLSKIITQTSGRKDTGAVATYVEFDVAQERAVTAFLFRHLEIGDEFEDSVRLDQLDAVRAALVQGLLAAQECGADTAGVLNHALADAQEIAVRSGTRYSLVATWLLGDVAFGCAIGDGGIARRRTGSTLAWIVEPSRLFLDEIPVTIGALGDANRPAATVSPLELERTDGLVVVLRPGMLLPDACALTSHESSADEFFSFAPLVGVSMMFAAH